MDFQDAELIATRKLRLGEPIRIVERSVVYDGVASFGHIHQTVTNSNHQVIGAGAGFWLPLPRTRAPLHGRAFATRS